MERISRLGLALGAIVVLCVFVGGGVACFSEEAEAASFDYENMLTCEIKTEPSDGKNGTVSISLKASPDLKQPYYSKDESYGILAIPSTVTRTVTKDGSTTIENYDVVAISDGGFQQDNKNINEFVLPNTLTKIGTYAFFQFHNLYHINIPANVDDISAGAFQNCTGLKTISLNEGLKEICSSAFSGCVNLESITIPDSLTRIRETAFQNCTSLANIVLGSGITTLDEKAFSYCASLKELTVPKKLAPSFNNINWNSNHSFSCLEKIIVEENSDFTSVDGIVYTKDMSKLVYCPPAKKNATIPAGVTQISSDRNGPQGFSHCGLLDNVTLPDGLEKINNYAFNQCRELQSIRIPDTVTHIGEYAFYYCDKLSTVEFPSNLNTIGNRAFSDCELLNDVHLPHGLTKIGSSAFQQCYALERIEIPATTTDIGPSAFSFCKGLLGVDLPDAIKTINNRTFYNCESLRTFVVPSGVEKIEELAFGNCTSLVSIEFQNNIKEISRYAFDYSTGDHADHQFFNKESNESGYSEPFQPQDNINNIKNKTYIGKYENLRFKFYEYTGTESDVRYNIRYYTNGGYNDFSNPPDILKGGTHDLVSATRDGYEFQGWYTDPEFKNQITTISGQTENIRLYAKWTPIGGTVEKHTLTIKYNGPQGSSFSDDVYEVSKGSTYEYNISKEGYDSNPSIVSGTMGPEDMTVFVTLTPKNYTITLVTNQPIASIDNGWRSIGGTKFTSTVPYGSKIVLPSPSYDERNCKWSPVCPTTMPAHDLEFTAEWQWIITLNFGDKLKDLDIEGWEKTDGQFTKGFFKGDAVVLPTITHKGYTVAWPHDAPTTMPNQDCTVVATVTAKSFQITISFENNTPSSIDGWESQKDGTFTKYFEYDSPVELPGSNDPELKIVWSPEPPAKMPAKNLEFTGKWGTATYEISITIGKNFPNEIDGWKHNLRGVYSKMFEYGSTITLPVSDIPGFISWGDGVTVPGTMPDHDLSFVAKQKDCYRIALPSGTGYTIEAMPGYDPSTIWAGDKYEFRIILSPSYDRSSPVVKVGDTVLEPVDGVYTIADIGSDLTVTVSGIRANPSSGGGSGGSGGSSTPTTPSKPDVKVDEDGTKTTTEKNPDGSVTETVEKTDGTTTVTKTEKDGSKTETTTGSDGSTVTKKTETDGSYTETATGADGSKTESSLTKTDTGTIETEKTFDSEGEETGSVEKKTETIEDDSGKMSSETVKTKDSEGKETVKKKMESSDGSLSISIDASIADGKASVRTEITINIVPGSDASEAVAKALELMSSSIKEDVTEGEADASHSMRISTEGEKTRISADSLAKISDLGMKASFDLSVGTVEFDSDASKRLSGSRGSIGISMARAAIDALSDAKKAAVGDMPAFEISAGTEDEDIHELGGTATITLSYELPVGVPASDVRAFYVDDDGMKHMMDTIFDAVTGKLSFITPHFSLYVIGTVADADGYAEDEGGSSAWIYAAAVAAVIVVAVAAIALRRRG